MSRGLVEFPFSGKFFTANLDPFSCLGVRGAFVSKGKRRADVTRALDDDGTRLAAWVDFPLKKKTLVSDRQSKLIRKALYYPLAGVGFGTWRGDGDMFVFTIG